MRRNIGSPSMALALKSVSKVSSGQLLFFTTLLVCVVMLAMPAFAQYRAGLQGVITDASGAVVPGATVTLTSKETNNTRTTTSSDSGVYSIASLAPGNYALTVEKSGFAKKVLDNVLVSAEQVSAANVELGIGESSQTVTVSADAEPALETQTATVGGTLTAREVQQLPSYGRDPLRLAQLAPGTFGDNARDSGGGSANLPGNAGPGGTNQSSSIFQTENQVQVSANGLRTTSNSFQIDGVSVNSLAWGGAAVVTPNTESVKEVRIESNSYSAENGRAGGAQVLVVSQNGTNNFHGSALLRVARPGLNAFNRWNGPNNPTQRATDRFNQWAGSIGGPIIKNRLFAFFSYETLRQGTQTNNFGWYETPQYLSAIAANPNSVAARFANFPGSGASVGAVAPRTCADIGISDPARCQSVSGGLDLGSPLALPLGTPDPTQGPTSAAYGVGSGLDGVPDVAFIETVNPNNTTAQQFNGRLDFQVTQNDLLAFSTYWVPVTSNFYNGPARPANLWNNDRLNQSGALLWNHTFGPSLLNEARFNVSRWHWNELESNPQEPWGIPQSDIDNMGGVDFPFGLFGPPGPSIFSQTTYNFRDTVSLIRGSHSLKLGTDIYWEQNNDSQVWASRPQFYFRNLWDFANDAPYRETGNFDPTTGQPTGVRKNIRSRIYSGFVQDDWKVRPTLTLNLGLRWEYFGPITETNGNISNAVLGTGANTLTDLSLRVGNPLYKASKNNWGPQVGFAYSPAATNGRFVVRGGFGIGYTRMEEAVTLNGRSNPPFVSNLDVLGSGVAYLVPQDVTQFTNWPINPVAVQTFDPVTNLPTTGTVALNIFPQDLQTPYTYRYSLDTQYDLGGNWTATIGYQGSNTRHYTRQTNLNWFFPQNQNASLSAVNYFRNDVNANFNALLGQIQHRFSRSFELDAQYRWSKTIDEGSNEYFIGQYPFDRNYLRGPADYDVRHYLKLYGVWSPRFFATNSVAEKILGGWQITGILNWHTGFPFSPLYSATGCNVIYTGSQYCDLLPGAMIQSPNIDESVDTFKEPNGYFTGGALNYFTVPVFSSNGTIPPPPGVGRNSLRGPRYFSPDVTLQKNFGLPKMAFLGEQARFEIRADFFNIFNKLNLRPDSITKQISTDGTTSNPQFGQAQQALAGRVINLQARFSF
jgi:hypothetical protein